MPTLLYEREVHTCLDIPGYRLIPGCTGPLGLPLEAFLRLYAVGEPGAALRIDSPESLAPLVARIGSEAEAWCFLRLFTSADTHYFFQKNAYLVDLRVAESAADVRPGVISSATAKALGYQAPTMDKIGGEYVSSRMLVRESARAQDRMVDILLQREGVSEDVEYRLIEQKAIARLPQDRVAVPAYE